MVSQADQLKALATSSSAPSQYKGTSSTQYGEVGYSGQTIRTPEEIAAGKEVSKEEYQKGYQDYVKQLPQENPLVKYISQPKDLGTSSMRGEVGFQGQVIRTPEQIVQNINVSKTDYTKGLEDYNKSMVQQQYSRPREMTLQRQSFNVPLQREIRSEIPTSLPGIETPLGEQYGPPPLEEQDAATKFLKGFGTTGETSFMQNLDLSGQNILKPQQEMTEEEYRIYNINRENYAQGLNKLADKISNQEEILLQKQDMLEQEGEPIKKKIDLEKKSIGYVTDSTIQEYQRYLVRTEDLNTDIQLLNKQRDILNKDVQDFNRIFPSSTIYVKPEPKAPTYFSQFVESKPGKIGKEFIKGFTFTDIKGVRDEDKSLSEKISYAIGGGAGAFSLFTGVGEAVIAGKVLGKAGVNIVGKKLVGRELLKEGTEQVGKKVIPSALDIIGSQESKYLAGKTAGKQLGIKATGVALKTGALTVGGTLGATRIVNIGEMIGELKLPPEQKQSLQTLSKNNDLNLALNAGTIEQYKVTSQRGFISQIGQSVPGTKAFSYKEERKAYRKGVKDYLLKRGYDEKLAENASNALDYLRQSRAVAEVPALVGANVRSELFGRAEGQLLGKAVQTANPLQRFVYGGLAAAPAGFSEGVTVYGIETASQKTPFKVEDAVGWGGAGALSTFLISGGLTATAPIKYGVGKGVQGIAYAYDPGEIIGDVGANILEKEIKPSLKTKVKSPAMLISSENILGGGRTITTLSAQDIKNKYSPKIKTAENIFESSLKDIEIRQKEQDARGIRTEIRTIPKTEEQINLQARAQTEAQTRAQAQAQAQAQTEAQTQAQIEAQTQTKTEAQAATKTQTSTGTGLIGALGGYGSGRGGRGTGIRSWVTDNKIADYAEEFRQKLPGLEPTQPSKVFQQYVGGRQFTGQQRPTQIPQQYQPRQINIPQQYQQPRQPQTTTGKQKAKSALNRLVGPIDGSQFRKQYKEVKPKKTNGKK